MNIRTRWGRWLLGTCLALGGSVMLYRPAQTQVPPAHAPGSSTVIPLNRTRFNLPIKMDENARSKVKKVRLYVKVGSADWIQDQEAGPGVQSFTYNAAQDGEYWFTVATVDKLGHQVPADPGKQPPQLRVIVDTHPPAVDLHPWFVPTGETCLQCELHDANPDYQSIQIIYHGRDGFDHRLDPHPFRPGLFRVPEKEIWNGNVRVMAADKCGNRISRDVSLKGMQPPQAVAATSSEPKETSVQQTSFTPRPATEKTPTPSIPSVSKQVNAQTPPSPTRANPLPATSAPMSPAPAPKQSADPLPAGPDLGPTTTTAPASSNPPRQLLATTHASLEYRIDQIGPSGVSKVEVWITKDQGQTWQRLKEDLDRRSPADIDLPGDGVYGITLVLTNGNGFGGRPPRKGDAPTAWIEVDLSPPQVQLPEVDPKTDNGTLTIRWQARDRNLGTEPVSLYCRCSPTDPWKLIARNLKNEDSYRWEFPRDSNSVYFFKVEAVDRVGNVGRAETANPVVLDMTEPRASVVGIVAVPK
jgi:hypothetical protein